MNIQDLMGYDYNFVITIVLFSTGFFYSLLTSMIFFKEIKKIPIIISIGIGYFYEEINMYIFSFYQNFNSNPQVSTVLYMASSTIILTAMIMFKRLRTRERVMVAMTSWTVIVAWFFIHFTLVVNQLVFIESKLLEVKQSAMIPFVANNDHEGFIDFCSNKKYECLILSTKMKLVDKTKDASRTEISNALKTIHPLKTYSINHNNRSYKAASGKNLFFNESAITFITISNNSNIYIIYDNNEIKEVYEAVKFHVYHWYGLVLFVWVSIGLTVITLHRKLFVKKQEERKC